MAASRPWRQRSARERGAVAVMSVLWISVALIGLMALDIGNLFWQRREMQRAADTAALAGGQMVGLGCDAARMHAEGNARNSGTGRANLTTADAIDVRCGNWDPARAPSGESPYFEAGTAPLNAVAVSVSRTVPLLFAISWNSPNRVVSARATAYAPDINVFSIGTGLLNLSDASPVNRLLNGLLGTTIDLDLVSFQGLSTAQLKLASLIGVAPLNAGNVQELLDTQVQLRDFVLASATALSQTDPVNANLLQTIAVGIKPLQMRLGDLLEFKSPTAAAAAQANVGVLDLLVGAAQLSNGKNFVDLGTMINLPGLASVDVKLAVIEPPRIAVGPVGTVARSAQVKAMVVVKALNVSLPNVLTLNALNLPIYIESASGTSTLENVSCADRRADASVRMEAETAIVSTCLSGMAATDLPTSGPTSAVCAQSAPITSLQLGLPVPLLGTVPVADVSLGVSIPIKASTRTTQDLTFGNGGPPGSDVVNSWQQINQNGLGTALSNLVTTLVAESTITPKVTLLGILPLAPLLGPLTTLTDAVRSRLGTVVGLLAAPLDATVSPLLRMLGIELGYSTVKQISMRCGDVQLVH